MSSIPRTRSSSCRWSRCGGVSPRLRHGFRLHDNRIANLCSRLRLWRKRGSDYFGVCLDRTWRVSDGSSMRSQTDIM